MFSKILIANRGEIACRVMHTAQAMGIKCVAVFSDADANAPHVKLADEAVHIGPAAASESYLRADKILDAAKRTGAQAVHPGYGFLSENAEFSDACKAAGIVFIGPSADTMRAMGSKSAAKDLMENAGVPTLKGYQGDDQAVKTFKAEAKRIGYPVLLKAAAGGGGKGMRLVEKESELEAALNAAKREAKSAFGDDRFLVEKFLGRPRHVEVQVFGDTHGNVVHLYERDCSVQRRHQKVLEEAPAPNLPEDVRAKLLKAGVDAAKAVNYVGAGTVEFLYDGADGVYFMEMNTRLQVEHPVTEEITGVDLVEWQLLVAAGEPIPLAQDEIFASGHAFESRLYAEDPSRDYAPSIGTLTTLDLPDHIARIDSGVEEGQPITPNYDPMIAKIITSGATREEALAIMASALAETHVAGLDTNATLLHRLTQVEDFKVPNLSTRIIEENEEELLSPTLPDEAVLAALGLYLSHGQTGWRLNASSLSSYWVEWDGAPALLQVSAAPNAGNGAFDISVTPLDTAAARRAGDTAGDTVSVSAVINAQEDGALRFTVDDLSANAYIAPHLDGWRVWLNGESTTIGRSQPLLGSAAAGAGGGGLTSPMPGVITALACEEGATVKAGDALIIMEAMKMEHTISAPSDGKVVAFKFAVGDQVSDGVLLVEFEAE